MCVRFVSAALTVVALAAAPVLVSASDKALSSNGNSVQSTTVDKASSTRFATMKGVKAVPMAAKELEAVKGLHVHFITVNNGKLHLAGDVKTENNWSNIGGTDGLPVAPSYNGLCVAHGNGAIFIPTGPPGTPVTRQCPPGS